MNYKKSLVCLAAISMLIFGGCSSSDKAAEETDAEITVSVSETTMADAMEADSFEEGLMSETEAQTESETVSETTTEEASSIEVSVDAEKAYSEKNGASWTAALMNSASTWDKGNVVIKCTASEEGEVVTTIEMSKYGQKVYMDTQVPGIMSMTMIIDGEKGYMIDRPSKTYSIDTENTYNAENEAESVLDTSEDYSSFAEDGIETIDGTEYIFEKFVADDSEITYYYLPDGKLSKVKSEGEIMDMTIELLDEPDESVFEIPEDYTEINMEEMYIKMMAGLMEAMEEDSAEE